MHHHGGRTFVFSAAPSTTHSTGRTSRLEGGHIRQQQGYVLPIPGVELEGKKILEHSTDAQISIATYLTYGLPVFSKLHRRS